MIKLAYKTQLRICMAILIICFILSIITKQGWFSNIAWIIYGLFFTINPVWPQAWDHNDHSKLKLGSRMAGIFAIIVGLTTRFGV